MLLALARQPCQRQRQPWGTATNRRSVTCAKTVPPISISIPPRRPEAEKFPVNPNLWSSMSYTRCVIHASGSNDWHCLCLFTLQVQQNDCGSGWQKGENPFVYELRWQISPHFANRPVSMDGSTLPRRTVPVRNMYFGPSLCPCQWQQLPSSFTTTPWTTLMLR